MYLKGQTDLVFDRKTEQDPSLEISLFPQIIEAGGRMIK
jgi:hypothetical protein